MEIFMLFRNSLRRSAARQRLAAAMLALVSAAMLAGLSGQAEAQSLMGQRHQFMGNPQCSDWTAMNTASRFEWTTVFLSTLSMGHETSRRKGQQKYKNHEGVEEVITAINAHCTANPAAQASEAAAPFLNP